jgi:hypothetical protein
MLDMAKQNYLVKAEDTRIGDYHLIPTYTFPKKEVTLEYLSGMKLSPSSVES